MPTVLRQGPYRFYFYSNEGGEPPHVHVEYQGSMAKVWLDPIAVARDGGLSHAHMSQIIAIIQQHRTQLIGEWNAYFTP